MGRHDVGFVTIRIADGLRSLRYHAESDAIYGAFVRARETCKVAEGFRVLQYSVQSNHLHLLVEASCDGDLQTGMRGLMACLGNALRRLWGMTGSVFADRYPLEVIQSPTRMRNALCYVLNNARKHGCWTKVAPDPYSSGPWFEGWAEEVAAEDRSDLPSPVSAPRSWLATQGWLSRGDLIGLSETPSQKSPKKKAPSKKAKAWAWNRNWAPGQAFLFA